MSRTCWSALPQRIREGLQLADPCAVVELHHWLTVAPLPRGTTAEDVEEVIDRLSSLVIDPALRCRLATARDPAAFVGVLLRDARVARLRRQIMVARAIQGARAERTSRVDRSRGEPSRTAEMADDVCQVRRRIQALSARQCKVLTAIWDGEESVVRLLADEFFGTPPTREKLAAVQAILTRARHALSARLPEDVAIAYGVRRAPVGRARTVSGSP